MPASRGDLPPAAGFGFFPLFPVQGRREPFFCMMIPLLDPFSGDEMPGTCGYVVRYLLLKKDARDAETGEAHRNDEAAAEKLFSFWIGTIAKEDKLLWAWKVSIDYADNPGWKHPIEIYTSLDYHRKEAAI